MSKTHDLIKEIISEHKYRILDEEGEYIAVRYQFHTIHFFSNSEDENFVSIVLTCFEEVTKENYSEIIMRCNKLNEQLKQVKFYITNDVVLVSSELFYKEKEDLSFQIHKSLLSLVAAKVRFKKMND